MKKFINIVNVKKIISVTKSKIKNKDINEAIDNIVGSMNVDSIYVDANAYVLYDKKNQRKFEIEFRPSIKSATGILIKVSQRDIISKTIDIWFKSKDEVTVKIDDVLLANKSVESDFLRFKKNKLEYKQENVISYDDRGFEMSNTLREITIDSKTNEYEASYKVRLNQSTRYSINRSYKGKLPYTVLYNDKRRKVVDVYTLENILETNKKYSITLK